MRGFKTWLESDYKNHPEMPNLVQSKWDYAGHKVVIVNVEKFDKAWSEDGNMYLPRGGRGANYIPIHGRGKPEGYNRYDRVREEIPEFKSKGKDFEMSTVELQYGNPVFTDGRHRFAYFRDLGIKNLPISVPDKDVDEMQKRFGIIK